MSVNENRISISLQIFIIMLTDRIDGKIRLHVEDENTIMTDGLVVFTSKVSRCVEEEELVRGERRLGVCEFEQRVGWHVRLHIGAQIGRHCAHESIFGELVHKARVHVSVGHWQACALNKFVLDSSRTSIRTEKK